ncbi:MAG: hypothetical protein K0U72_17115 [Gammaproteobacteria bacterium]|nr:hypothetical protein [Gammaproteobacteria bacterium]
MATAEKLLHEAQYAYQCISFGESRDNRRNRSKATSLAKKIIRKYPASMEAGEARAILRRLGEEAYSVAPRNRHTHALPYAPQETQHSHSLSQTQSAKNQRIPSTGSTTDGQADKLELGRLIIWLIGLPRYLQIVFVFVGFVLLSIFGPFLLIPLALVIFLATPLRQFAPAEMKHEVNVFVRSVNAWVIEREDVGK